MTAFDRMLKYRSQVEAFLKSVQSGEGNQEIRQGRQYVMQTDLLNLLKASHSEISASECANIDGSATLKLLRFSIEGSSAELLELVR